MTSPRDGAAKRSAAFEATLAASADAHVDLTSEANLAAVPAATVILLRDRAAGPDRDLEVLVLRRNSRLAFAGGMWVFPGGRVDAADAHGVPLDSEAAARRAASREAREEAGLAVEPTALVPWSHWTPPSGLAKRFSTWFFVSEAPPGTVHVDGGEIHAFQWISPQEALTRRDAGEIELTPPTWITPAWPGITRCPRCSTKLGLVRPRCSRPGSRSWVTNSSPCTPVTPDIWTRTPAERDRGTAS